MIETKEFGQVPSKVGEFFTLLNWREPLMSGHYDNSYKGEVLKVLAVDYPYVVFLRLPYNARVTLDLRRVELRRLSEEFVKARLGE